MRLTREGVKVVHEWVCMLKVSHNMENVQKLFKVQRNATDENHTKATNLICSNCRMHL